MAADVGTLQRLPKIIGNGGLIRELAFSARKMYADEALQVTSIVDLWIQFKRAISSSHIVFRDYVAQSASAFHTYLLVVDCVES